MNKVDSVGNYDVAYVAGGAHRCVDTAVCTMVQDGRVRVSRSGDLSVVEQRADSAVEAAVLTALADGPRTIAGVHSRAVQDPRVAEQGQRLARAGLMRRPTSLWSLGAGHLALRPTGSGRRLLRSVSKEVAMGSGDARDIALQGPWVMADQEARRAIFEQASKRPRRRRSSGRWTGGAGGSVWSGSGGCGGSSGGGCGGGSSCGGSSGCESSGCGSSGCGGGCGGGS